MVDAQRMLRVYRMSSETKTHTGKELQKTWKDLSAEAVGVFFTVIFKPTKTWGKIYTIDEYQYLSNVFWETSFMIIQNMNKDLHIKMLAATLFMLRNERKWSNFWELHILWDSCSHRQSHLWSTSNDMGRCWWWNYIYNRCCLDRMMSVLWTNRLRERVSLCYVKSGFLWVVNKYYLSHFPRFQQRRQTC